MLSGGHSATAAVGDHFGHLIFGYGTREEITLHLIASNGGKESLLLPSLDTLSGYCEAHGVAKGHHSADDGRGINLLPKVLDESSVDLDFVDTEVAQIAKRRIAGAEIVQGDLEAGITQRL